MKARSSFVSNSSSSSFIIIGKKINQNEVINHGYVWFIGSEYGEGVDAFELDESYRQAISDSGKYICGEFIAAIKAFSGEGDEQLDEEDLKNMLAFGKVDVVAFDKSHYSSIDRENIDEFFERYAQ